MSESARVEPWKLVLIGLAAGVLSGGLGVGGGIILVPLLVIVGLDRHRAHATSLAAIMPIAVAGAASYGLSGELALALGVAIGLGGAAGSVIGATVMHRSSPRMLTIIFSALLVLVAVRMISGAEPLPGTTDLSSVLQVAVAVGIGAIAGFFAGLAGIGGGVVIVPAGVFLLALSQHEAQGVSLVAIVFTAVAATVVNRRNRRVRLSDGLVAGVGGIVGSILGSQVALAMTGRTLSVIFGFLVLFAAVQSLYRGWRSRSQPPETETVL
ncbi:MAG: sulfite exporter TauE/SafE family protein [Acidimicrobiia bacterium]